VANALTKPFDVRTFLGKKAPGGRVLHYPKGEAVFSQGDPADSVFYVQKGKIKVTVESQQGKEAVLAIFESGSFLGEGCLAGQPLRMSSARAMTEATALEIDKATMRRTLRDEPAFSEVFMSYVLSRNVRVEEDLVDHLFNAAERRLARALLLLAHYGDDSPPLVVIPKISQETLAEMIGTTRSRINLFMNKFRKLGLIDYNGVLKIHGSLLSVLLKD
jgi:CRP-like cAMP-binding protein